MQLEDQNKKQIEGLHELYAKKINMLSSMNDENVSAQQQRFVKDLTDQIESIFEEYGFASAEQMSLELTGDE
jgi:ribosome assembly protein YihI (activator of Der GTPase)